MRFKDKVVAITGAGSGIGKQTALDFAKEGANVAVMDINEENVNAVAAELKALGTAPLALVCDVSDSKQVDTCFEEIEKKYGTLDVLFSNAGVVKGGLAETITDEIWDYNMHINLNGTFYTNRAALRIMKPKGKGKIVNMSSMFGGMSDKGACPGFSASKAGIVGFTRCAGIQAARAGINMNAIAPGYISTPIHSPEFKKKYPELAAETPIGRVGDVKEISGVVLFLASEDASFMVGQVVSPNGGVVV